MVIILLFGEIKIFKVGNQFQEKNDLFVLNKLIFRGLVGYLRWRGKVEVQEKVSIRESYDNK